MIKPLFKGLLDIRYLSNGLFTLLGLSGLSSMQYVMTAFHRIPDTPKRRHSYTNGVSPVEFENQYFSRLWSV